MTRILADLPDEDIEKLDALADKSKLSRPHFCAMLLRNILTNRMTIIAGSVAVRAIGKTGRTLVTV
jgi:hypothetical protein